jgi:hypothetical protein
MKNEKWESEIEVLTTIYSLLNLPDWGAPIIIIVFPSLEQLRKLLRAWLLVILIRREEPHLNGSKFRNPEPGMVRFDHHVTTIRLVL